MVILAFVWALAAVGSRADARMTAAAARDAAPAPPAAPARRLPVVADTGGIRAHLRAAAGLIDAEQLTVSVDVDGTEAVLASSRAVVEAQAGDWQAITAPVLLGGRDVARLRAVRRPDAPPFDSADRLLLRGVAARVSGSMQAGHPSTEVAFEESGAMA